MLGRGGAARFRSQHLLFAISQHGCSLSAEIFSVSLGWDLISVVFVKPFDFFQLSGIFQQPTKEPQSEELQSERIPRGNWQEQMSGNVRFIWKVNPSGLSPNLVLDLA